MLAAAAFTQPAQAAPRVPAAAPPCSVTYPKGESGDFFGLCFPTSNTGTVFYLKNDSDDEGAIFIVQAPEGTHYTFNENPAGSAADLDDLVSKQVYGQIEKAYPTITGTEAIIAPDQALTVSSNKPLQLKVRPDLVAGMVNTGIRSLVKPGTAYLFDEDYAKGRALAECFSFLRTELDKIRDKSPTEAQVQNLITGAHNFLIGVTGRQSCDEAFSQSTDDAGTGKHMTPLQTLEKDTGKFATEDIPELLAEFFDPLYHDR
jgi:hypothetical protein